MPIARPQWANEIERARANIAWGKAHPGADIRTCPREYLICLEPEDFLDLIGEGTDAPEDNAELYLDNPSYGSGD
ncbi:MAG TPA: hypothetical protein VN444_04005 [Verrucomicrobiae bacterium]|nr:hypothetical protein [Verrucomicrobiae bacterium]